MSRRLQVVVDDAELERFATTADAAGLTLSEWARQTLRAAERSTSSGDVDARLAIIRKAAAFQTGGREVDIEEMLAETEAGRLGGIDAGLPPRDA